MSTASERLALYLAAEKAILEGGQQARVNNPATGKEVTWADLGTIQASILKLERQVQAEAKPNSGIRFSVATFGDPQC